MSLTREASLGELPSARNMNLLLILNKKYLVSKYAS